MIEVCIKNGRPSGDKRNLEVLASEALSVVLEHVPEYCFFSSDFPMSRAKNSYRYTFRCRRFAQLLGSHYGNLVQKKKH